MKGRKRKPRGHDRSTGSPEPKKKRDASPPPERREKAAPSILVLPAEVVEYILFNLSAKDVMSFGSTCRYFHELSLSQAVWKRLYHRNFGPTESNDEINWRRVTILKMTQGLVLHSLDRELGHSRFHQHSGPAVVQTFNSPMALGFRRVVPIWGQTLLWDHNGTIFSCPRSILYLGEPLDCFVMCHQAKDFAVDPNLNKNHRKFIYVLRRLECTDYPSPELMPPTMCDVVDVYHWATHKIILRLNLNLNFSCTQIRLSGPKEHRCLLLLKADGKLVSVYLNETHLHSHFDFTVEMTLINISSHLPELSVRQVHTSPNRIVYITDEGSVFAEVHSSGAYRQMCGTYIGFNPTVDKPHCLFSLEVPSKVVKCSMGLNHMCLLDDSGRLFMQGCNQHGQLGTGDKLDRCVPTQMEVSMLLLDAWCGINHTLLLLEDEHGDKQVQGCGSGSRGRLPGYLEGSLVFVRLDVKVPPNASSLCSSRKWLYFICGHDIASPPA